MMTEPAPRRGRPKKEGGAKNAPLNMRTTPWLRERIEEAAEHFGTSLSSEVERRLISSFLFDQANGGPNVATFAHLIAATIHDIQERVGKQWVEDPATFEAIKIVVNQLLEMKRPKEGVLAHYAQGRHVFTATDEATEAGKQLAQFLQLRGCDDNDDEQLAALSQPDRGEYLRLSSAHRAAMEKAIMASTAYIEHMREQERVGSIAAEVAADMFDRIGPKAGG